jgi:hypothetical protein
MGLGNVLGEGARAILSGYKSEVQGEAGHHMLRGLIPQCTSQVGMGG